MQKNIMVTSPALPPFEEYVEEISSLWETKWLTHTGPKHVELEEKLEAYLGVKNVALFANGHLALELAIEAMGLSGEIITTPFTFGSTTQAILRNGIEPVFCDVNDEDYTIDVAKIEELITPKTTAIIPVHVYGNACDVKEIDRIAKKSNLKVIYDAAHAFGMQIDGKPIAQYGDMSMFSFHATKVFNTVEGGCIAFHDSKYEETFKSLRQFGQIVKTDDVPMVGTNAKMTEMHAAMGLCNLRHIDEYIQKRKKLVTQYRERLGAVCGIKLCGEQTGVVHNYAYLPVIFDKEKFGKDRNEIAEILENNGIYARKYFYPLTCDFEIYQKMYGTGRVNVPVAEKLANSVLTLPLYADLQPEDVDRICDVILGK